MATGIKNIPHEELPTGDVIAFQHTSVAGSSSKIGTGYYGYQHEYLSFNSGTFTVLKNFSANIMFMGKGSYKQNSGGSGRTIKYTFSKTSNGTTTTISSGSLSTSTISASASFAKNDTFNITVTVSGSGGCGSQAGFIMTIA